MPSKKKSSKKLYPMNKVSINDGMDIPKPPLLYKIRFFEEKEYLFLVSKKDIMSQLLFNPIILLIVGLFLSLTWNSLSKDAVFIAGMVVGAVAMILFVFGLMVYRGENNG